MSESPGSLEFKPFCFIKPANEQTVVTLEVLKYSVMLLEHHPNTVWSLSSCRAVLQPEERHTVSSGKGIK